MGKHPITAVVAGLAIAAFAIHARAEEPAGQQPITFYGTEMKREDQVSIKEFKNFARSHGQANYVISKSALLDYEGTGDVILADYGLDRATAEKAAAEIPGKAKVLEFRVLPQAVSDKKGVAVFRIPLLATEDSIGGDVWVRTATNPPQRIEQRVVLSSLKPNLANQFKFVGFTDKETGLAYCVEQCTRLDLVSGQKTPLAATKGEDAAGIRRSVDNLLNKEKAGACKNGMSSDEILNVDNQGYYRGICPAKGNEILHVQLKKDSGRWKVLNSDWQTPMIRQK
jgi:hypothetical protein